MPGCFDEPSAANLTTDLEALISPLPSADFAPASASAAAAGTAAVATSAASVPSPAPAAVVASSADPLRIRPRWVHTDPGFASLRELLAIDAADAVMALAEKRSAAGARPLLSRAVRGTVHAVVHLLVQ